MVLDETKQIVAILKDHGVEAVHVSAGSACSTPPWFFQHMFIKKGKTWDMARQIRKATGLPVVAVGRINRQADVDELLGDENIDFLAVGRALIADPDFVAKVSGTSPGVVIPCLACAQGCLGGVKAGKGLACLVNPEAGLEGPPPQAGDAEKKIAVVGGGLAGMQAAISLKKRGFDVTIFEKDSLGGQFRYAPLTPHKRPLAALIPAFTALVRQDDIPVVAKEPSADDLADNFDLVMIATGSRPTVPPIPGLKTPMWAEILLDENLPHDKNVVIIGGGPIGVDVATALTPLGNRVKLIEMTEEFGRNMEMIAQKLALTAMKNDGVELLANTVVTKIEGRTVHAEQKGQTMVFEDVDLVVAATGTRPYSPLAQELADRGVKVVTIGDAQQVGNAQDAITGAWKAARELAF